MSDQEGLLAAIRDDPLDDVPRLACADWLEEQGGPGEAARAELIRVQLALAGAAEDDPARPELLLRERELLDAHQLRWNEPLADVAAALTFVRGFPEQATLTAEDFLIQGERLFELAPITHLELVEASPVIDQVARSPLLGRLHTLALRGERGLKARGLRALLESPHLARLRKLELAGHGLEREGARLLAEARRLGGLRELLLGYNRLGDEGVERLLQAPWLGRLTRLDLCANNLSAAAVEHLTAGDLPALRHLDLGYNNVGNAGADLLAWSSLLSGLEVLRLGRNAIEREGVAALARSPYSGGLRHLDLGLNYVGRAGMRALAWSPHLARLRILDLRLDIRKIDDGGCGYLADSPYLTHLTRLDLSSNGIGPEGVAALAGSANLRHLRLLDLYHNRIGTEWARALQRSPYLGRLTHLNLNGAGLGAEGVEALADSPNLAYVLELDLRGNNLGRTAGPALAQSPHLRPVADLWLDEVREGKALLQQRFGERVRFW